MAPYHSMQDTTVGTSHKLKREVLANLWAFKKYLEKKQYIFMYLHVYLTT